MNTFEKLYGFELEPEHLLYMLRKGKEMCRDIVKEIKLPEDEGDQIMLEFVPDWRSGWNTALAHVYKALGIED
jgi:hypothetical protein